MTARRPLALVTGASGGIGAEFAAQLAPTHDLVLVSRSEERLDAVAARLASPGRSIEVVPADLSTADGVDAVLSHLARRATPVDLLVNNAGSGSHGPFLETPDATLVEQIDLDVTAVVRLTRALLPAMVSGRSGGVITVASTSAFQATPDLAAYAAAKAFVLSLSEALAVEVRGSGVTITAVAPGTVATGFFAAAGARFEVGGMLTPAAVVTAALHGFSRGRGLVIPGARNRLGTLAPRLLPRRLMARMAQHAVRAR